jgi:glycosyltransferase involved in cell wall biosynthesis
LQRTAHLDKNPTKLVGKLVKLLRKLPAEVAFDLRESFRDDTLHASRRAKSRPNIVVLTGCVSESEKNLSPTQWVFRFASTYEGASLPVLEAVAPSKLVVTSKVGGVPFLVEDGS